MKNFICNYYWQLFTAMSLAACGSGSGKTEATAAAGTERRQKKRGDAEGRDRSACGASGDSISSHGAR